MIALNKRFRCQEKGKYSKNFGREIKSPFMIYADFGKILVAENNEKQIPNEFYTNKYQKHVDDKFSQPFMSMFAILLIV